MGISLKNIREQQYEDNYKKVGTLNLAKPKKQVENTTPWYKQLFKNAKGLIDDEPTIYDVPTILGATGTDLLLGAAKGVASVGEGVGKTAASLIAEATNSDRIRNNIATLEPPVSSAISKVQNKYVDPYSLSGNSLDKVAEATGYTAGMAVAGKYLPNKGNIPIGKLNMPILAATSGMGSGFQEAYQNGAKGLKAIAKGVGSGAIEGITEGLFGMFGVGGNEITDELGKKIANNFKSGIAKVLAKTGVSSAGEATEEFLSYTGNQILDYLIDKVSSSNDPKFYKNWNWEEVGEEMAVAFISSAISQGGSTAINVRTTYNNAVQELENKLGRSLTTEEQQSLKEKVINSVINEETQQKVDNTEISQIEADIEELRKKRAISRDNQKQAEYTAKINNLEQQLAEVNKTLTEMQQNDNLQQNKVNLPIPNVENKVNLPKVNVNTQISAENLPFDVTESELNKVNKNLKQEQLDIINKSNPMMDEYHTGIRNIDDIKTLEETLQDSDYIDYDEFNPDLTRQDIENAIKKGTIMVYSSYPIENGTFVSPSKMEAESYSGNGKVYSKEVNINDVAWIDPTQGQFAKTANKYYNESEVLENGRTNSRYASQPISENEKYGNGSYKGIVNQENQGSESIRKSNEGNIDRGMFETTRRNNDRSIEEKTNERQNGDRIPNKDDEGKMVSEDQRRFNQNVSPLVKNKNGELLHFFHGSDTSFSEFDLSKGGKSNSKASVGFWFTKSKEGATKWAKETLNSEKPIIYDTYLKIENPKIYESVDNSTKINQLEEQLSKLEKERMSLYNKLQDNYDNSGDAITYYGLSDEQTFKNIFRDRGYKNYNELYEDTKNFINTRNTINNLYDELELLKFAQDSYNLFLNDIYDIEGTKPSERQYNKGVSKETLEKYRQQLIEQGYDGIAVIDTEYDENYFGSKNTQMAALFANQIKDVNNMHPTESNDIYDKANNVRLPKKEVNLPKAKQETRTRKDYLNESNNYSMDSKIINKISKNMKQELSLNSQDMEEFKRVLKEVSNNPNISENKIKQIIEDRFSEKNVKIRIEDIANIQNVIRNYRINVSDDIKMDIADYSDFKQSNFGKIRFSKEGVPVDVAYQELSSKYPNYFPDDIVNPTDQLQEIAYVANLDKYATETGYLPESAINDAAEYIYESIQDDKLAIKVKEGRLSYDEYLKLTKIGDLKKTRSMVQDELRKQMGITEEDLQAGKDISSIGYQRTDPIRLNEKVFGYEVGNKINDATIRQTKHNEAERTRFLNKERKEIADLGIKARSKESAAVQKYGEKQYINDKGEVIKYGDRELAAEFPNVETQNKIKNAAKVMRNKYDNYIEEINSVITNMGYDAIPKRPDYFRHFQELDDKLTKYGVPINRQSLKDDVLPTDINGITDQFKPGKNWFASAMQRKGMKTTYDAVTGIDGYLEGASNLMYHTEDIQRYRTLSKMVRDTFGQQHGLDNINLDTKEGQQRLNDIFDNKLSKYAAWLDEQANALAGKKGAIDRGAERVLGRRIYSVLDAAKKQVGSNMTGFNVRSALTNFASAVQGASKVKKTSFLKGTLSTIQNMIHNDGLINKSDFLTSRFGSNQLSKKLWQKASNAGQILMSGTDYFTANQIWRSKYYENLSNGMSENQAIKSADDFAARIMGDRSKGSTAEAFNSKTLGLLTQFQLEVNNQWSSIIHDNKIDVKAGNKSGATVLFQLGQLAAMSYMFNNFMKAMTGSDVMIDPLDMLKKIFGGDDDEEKTTEERAREVLGDLVNDLPFVSFLTGGRVPMSEAFKGTGTLAKYLTGQKDTYGNDIKTSDVKKDLIESAYYWLLPTGYGQLKKTTKGLSMYDKNLPIAGSYTDSGNLRFKADESTGGKIKAALFGQYSSKEAQDYISGGYKTVSKSHIKELQDLDMSSSEYVDYRKKLNAAGTTNADKINFIANSNYTDKQKNIMASNVLNKDFDIKEYKKYNSYDEYDYAQKNPEKYSVISQITDYDKYTKYKAELKNIRDNTTNDKEETIKYINSLKLSIPQKAMFIKQYYSSYNDYNKQIVEYINSQKISKSEKEQILKQLKFTIKDGRVYW